MTTRQETPMTFHRYGTAAALVASAAGQNGGTTTVDAVFEGYAEALARDGLLTRVGVRTYQLTPEGWEAAYAHFEWRRDYYAPGVVAGRATDVLWLPCPKCQGMGSHWALRPGRVEADSIADLEVRGCDYCLTPNGLRGMVPAQPVEHLFPVD